MTGRPSSEALALDLQQRERVDPHTGCKEILPALHQSWCKSVNFLCYVPPESAANSALSLLWLEALELMDSDLHWLLCQPHQKFWCQVIYDTSLHKLLDSYLHHGPRPHEATPPVSLRGREVLASLHRRVFMTFLRMSTHKESADHFLLEDSFGDIIYNHFLFDITRLLDLCSLYQTCNQPLLAKMVSNIFQRQPRYQDDLKSALNSVLNLLDRVTGECVGERGGKKGAVRLEDLQSLPPSAISDMVLYIADIACSLRSFLEVYPPSVSLAVECGLLERLVVFYEETIPPLQEQWKAIRHSLDPDSVAYQKSRLRQGKRDLTWLVHTMLRGTFLAAGDSQVEGGVARFVDIVTSILSETAFLREMERHFSLAACVREVQTLHPKFDHTQFDYVLAALGVGAESATPGHAAASTSLTTPIATGVGDRNPRVLHVLELLPYLTGDFVERCLREYGQDPGRVVHHVLEGSLPPHLRNLLSGDDESVRSEGGDGVRSEGGLLEQRVGVFDGDEFDVFHRSDVDLSHVHIGKRSLTTVSTLHDRSHLEENRDRYQSYQFEIPSDQEEGEYEFDQYQDEYDDTYDSLNVGAADNETAEDLFTVKRLNVKGLFRKQFDTPAEDEEEGEADGEGGTESTTTPLLAGHVTVLQRDHRQRGRKDDWEKTAAQPARGGMGGRGRGGGGGGGRGGAGKGAGREGRDRQLKEKHKGRVANHSRKVLADRKRGGRGFSGPPQF